MGGEDSNSCLGEIYFNYLQKYTDRIFLYIGETGESVTYSEVFTQSVRTAIHLKKKGITRNDVVCTCTLNQKYSYMPAIASQYLGILCANLDPKLSQSETVALLKLTEPKVLFVAEESLEFIENCLSEAGTKTDLVIFGTTNKYNEFSEYLQPDKAEKNFLPVKVDEKETAVIIFSSGTTGVPKGICLSHKSLKTYIMNSSEITILLFSNMSGVSAHINLVRSIASGHSIVMCKDFDPTLCWKLIEKYKIFSLFFPPYYAVECLSMKPENVDVSSIKYVATGSAPVTTQLMEDLKKTFPYAQVINFYHQTEAGAVFCYFQDYDLQLKYPLSSGKIMPHVEWKVIDVESDEVLGPNKEGELRIKHEYNMNGYYKTDTSSAFDSEGYLKTGDIVYYNEDNCLFVADRLKAMFKCKGWHILPAIQEGVLKTHPAVREAAVIGVPHDKDGFHPMGFIVLHNDYVNTKIDDILEYTNGKLWDYQYLRGGLKVVKSIPKTVTGKVHICYLKEMVLNTK